MDSVSKAKNIKKFRKRGSFERPRRISAIKSIPIHRRKLNQ